MKDYPDWSLNKKVTCFSRFDYLKVKSVLFLGCSLVVWNDFYVPIKVAYSQKDFPSQEKMCQIIILNIICSEIVICHIFLDMEPNWKTF